MRLNHLHLHVSDTESSQRFYAGYFGLRERVRHGDIRFLDDGSGFDLALAPGAGADVFPAWFHFGFRLDGREAVRALCARMQAAGVSILKPLYEDPELISFRCADPDGYAIEVYHE